MKHLGLSVAGALILAGSLAVYAQAQETPKEPIIKKEEPGRAKTQQQSNEGQGDRMRSGQADNPDRKKGPAMQGAEQTDKGGNAKDAENQDRDRNRGGKAGSEQQDNKSAQQNDNGPKEKGKQRHAGKPLEPKQKTVVKQVIVKRNVHPVKVHFSINIGAPVPRSVTLYDLPPELIEYEPGYAGYKFVLADDDTLLVIDPDTWEIVDIIEI